MCAFVKFVGQDLFRISFKGELLVYVSIRVSDADNLPSIRDILGRSL